VFGSSGTSSRLEENVENVRGEDSPAVTERVGGDEHRSGAVLAAKQPWKVNTDSAFCHW
jgi:hypothetical protein